jgi:hypothetical protein
MGLKSRMSETVLKAGLVRFPPWELQEGVIKLKNNAPHKAL